jgi:hypothetical protein
MRVRDVFRRCGRDRQDFNFAYLPFILTLAFLVPTSPSVSRRRAHCDHADWTSTTETDLQINDAHFSESHAHGFAPSLCGRPPMTQSELTNQLPQVISIQVSIWCRHYFIFISFDYAYYVFFCLGNDDTHHFLSCFIKLNNFEFLFLPTVCLYFYVTILGLDNLLFMHKFLDLLFMLSLWT